MLDDVTLRGPDSPPSIPNFDDYAARKKAATAGVRPGLTWGAQRTGHRHQGLDFDGPMNSDVGSADDGEVVFSGNNGNMGNAVKIRHADGTVSVYGHLNKINVQVGDRVKRGASIGLLGQTGNAKGPHVHFETYKDNLPIDPAGTSLRPRIGLQQQQAQPSPATSEQPQIPAFDDWVKTRQTSEPPAAETQIEQQASPLKTPQTSVTLGEGAIDESTPLPTAKPVDFTPSNAIPRKAQPIDLAMMPFEQPQPSGSVENQLTQQRYKTPPSTELGQAVKIPFSPHLNPSEDDVVKGYLNALGPDYVKYGERYKQETGRNILSLSPGDLDRDPDGSIYVKPSRAAVDVLNAYVKSGGDINAAKAEGARIGQERRGAVTTAQEQAAPDIAEVQAARTGLGTYSGTARAIESPIIRYGAGKISQLGGLVSGFGVAPNKVSDYLNTRGKIMELGSTLPPLTPQGEQIQRSVPEKVGTALGDLGLGVFDIVAMKRATGLSIGQVMALEAALKDSDAPAPQRAAKVAQAYAMGKILDGHLDRITSAGVFAVPPGVEGAQQVARGEKSKTDALLDVAIQGGFGAIMGGGKEKDFRTPEVQARESLGIERAPTVPNFDQVVAGRESRVTPPQEALSDRQINRQPVPPAITRPVEPDAGDPQFRGMNNEQLQSLIDQRPAKGTSRASRNALASEQASAQREMSRRTGEPPLAPVNAPIAGEAKPTDETPSFQEYVENRPGGGIRFDSLEPGSPDFNNLAQEYVARYGTREQTPPTISLKPRPREAKPVIQLSPRQAPEPTTAPSVEPAANIPSYEDWLKAQDAKPKPPAKILPPIQPLTMGRESQSVTERGSQIDSRYAVANLDDLITSHDSALRPNPDFPTELQPRERDRAASADQVSRIASNLRPEFLGESPKASEGAPIVGPDGVVESGNGRVLGLRQAYESNNRGSQEYRRFLLDNAEKFGLDPVAIKDAKSPVLVRVRTTEVDRPKFVREANEQSISSMSPMEQARSDARSLRGPLLDLFNPSEAGDIGSAGNLPFVRAFMKDVVGPNEVNRYVTSSGHISQEGISRIRNAVFARAYGDSPEGLIALEKIAEDPDNNVRNLTTAMLRNAGGFASLKEGIDQGTRYPLDLAPDVSAAMSKLSHLRDQGMPVADYLNQGALYGNDLTPLQRRLLQVFDENKRGANIIDAIMKNYLRGADAAGSPTQEGLFGDAYIPAKEDFLEAAIKEAIDGQTISRGLFAAQDQGLSSEPSARGQDSTVNTPNAGGQFNLEPPADTRIEKPPADQGQDNPVRRFDSTIDRLKEQEQQARDRLAERGARAEELFTNREAGATTIPQDLYDFVVIGASKLAQRSLSLAQFVDEMVREFGAAIRSHAREIFRLSRKMVTDTQAQIRNERLSKEIADRLFTENVPKEQQIAAMKLAAQFRTTSDTQGKFIAGFKSRVGEMAKSYGAAGAELTNKLHEGDIARAHEMEAGNLYLSRVKDVYDDVKNDFERQRISRSVIDALEDRANADRHLDTPEKRTVYENTRDMLDEFRTKLNALGYETRDDYFTHMQDVSILDQIMSDAKDPHEASLNDRVAAQSRFLRPREDAKIEIQKDLPRVLFTYLKSVTKEIAYSDAVDYYYEHFPNDIPIGLRGNKMDRAITLMQNSLDPEKGRGMFYRVAGKLRNEQYRNFLAYNLKAASQNFTQVDFARMRWTPEARSLSGKLWRQRKTLTGPLADAIDIASTEETPLMRFLEQFSGSEDPGGTRGRFSKTFDKYDPFQRSERRNWALSELGSIINSVVKRPEYKALKAKMGAEGAINEMLKKQDVFDAAVREASTTAAETQVASNPAMRGEFYDAPLHRIIGMFTAFKTRQLQILGEALRSHEGINGARAQTILRRGLSGDAQPVEVLREVETQRKAMETMLKRARKFNEDIGISNRHMQTMIDHLKTQEGELNNIIRRIEPLSGGRVRSALLVGKYFAKVSAISVFFNLFWNSIYDAISPPEKDQDADERVSTALKSAFWDVMPSPFYGADPSKFLVSPVAPNFEKSAPYGHITRRGLAQDVASYGSSVIPFAGVADRATNRRLSRGMVNLLAPKTEKTKKAEY